MNILLFQFPFWGDWFWTAVFIAALTLFFVWMLLNMKKNRSDGTYLRKVPPYRTMLGYMMPTRNESVVYFDSYVDAEKLLQYIDDAKEKFPCNITHCIVGAVVHGMMDNPKMNQFVTGHRLYMRNDINISFSAKRKKKDSRAKLTAIKYTAQKEHTFRDFCEWVDNKLTDTRSDKILSEDKELKFYASLPRPILRRAMGVVRWLDYHNILPASFIKHDAFYASAFIANLGSVGMAPGYHHLYEWGNASLFIMAGKIEDKPIIENGEVKIKKILHIRYSYDERIEDGLTSSYGINSVKGALEDPYRYFGCLADDGSDAYKFKDLPSVHGKDNRHREAPDT